jgi:DNA-binding MarR family transcriptional regulator
MAVDPARICVALDRPSMIRFVIGAHRLLKQSVAAPLISTPSWDMLLDLYAHSHARPLSITDLCLASDVPLRTAVRHIDILIKKGMLQTSPDPRDGRRTIVQLTPGAIRQLNALFDAFLELIADAGMPA